MADEGVVKYSEEKDIPTLSCLQLKQCMYVYVFCTDTIVHNGTAHLLNEIHLIQKLF